MNNFNQSFNNYVPQKNQFSSYFNPANGVGTSTNNIIWVQGIEGAKAWQLNPNSMVILLDSEAEGKMYIKVSDNIGMSSLRIFNYTEVVQQTSSENVTESQGMDLSQFVKKDELSSLIKEVLDEQFVSTIKSESDESTSSGNGDKYKVVSIKK